MRLHPELLERLAAEYALGTLQGGARRRLEALARQQPEVREAVQRWQHQLASLTELAPPQEPPPQLWKRIEAVLRADLALRGGAQAVAPTVAPAAPKSGRLALVWPGLLGAGLVLAGAWFVAGQQRGEHERSLNGLREQLALQTAQVDAARNELAQVTRIGYVSVLNDDKSGAALLVTFDAERQQLMVKRVGAYKEAEEKSLQLWTIAPGAAPKSLGVLGRDALERLRAAQADVAEQRLLAVSLEPLGGVPSEGGPTGPVLFKGPVLKTEV
jgi:anti-sigma-K factor RskA